MKYIKRFLQINLFLLILTAPFTQGYSQAISPRLFGVNAWMPDTIGTHVHYGKLHKSWEAIRESGASIVRFGGISPDENMPTNYQYIKMIDSIRAKGMEPIMQVPFYNNKYTAQQAATIVHYVNVVRDRKVKYWIIANEPNLIYSYTTAAQVAAYFKPFASAMKNVDPSILIIGPETASFKKTITDGLTNPGGPDDITGKDPAGHYYLDVFSFHTYPMGSGGASRSLLVSKLTSTGSFQDNLAYLNTRVAACNAYHNRAGTSTLKTAVTETNVNYTNSADDDLYGTGANSFVGAQFAAEIYGIGMKRGVDFINLWSAIEGNTIANDCGYLEQKTGKKKPLYYHFQLMADNLKGNYADCITNMLAVKSFASKSPEEICVIILNEDSVTNFNYTIRLNTAAIGTADPLKINVDAGIAVEHRETIPSQSTVLLAFDLSGKLIRKCEYFLLTHASANLPPQCTDYNMTTSVSDNADGKFSVNVFPSPSDGKFTIELSKGNSGDEDFNIGVLNLLGQEVYSEKSLFEDGKQRIDLPGNIASGIYLIRVGQGDNVVTRKITVIR